MPRIRLTEQIDLDLSGQANNLICVGPVGSGKTQLLYHVLMSLYAQDCVVYAADLKGGAGGSFYSLVRYNAENGEDYAINNAEDFDRVLDMLLETMKIRYQSFADPNVPLDIKASDLNDNWKPIYLLVDEYSSGLAILKKSKSTRELGERIERKLLQLVQQSRQAEIGIILSFQYLKADTLPREISDQMMKIGLGAGLSTQSKIQLFDKAINLPRGDFSEGVFAGYVQRPTDVNPLYFQCPDLSSIDFRQILSQIVMSKSS